MKRIISFILAIAASLCILSSCDLDMVGDYVYYNNIALALNHETEEETKAVKDQLVEYFKAIPDFDKKGSFHGSYYEAQQMAAKFYESYIPKFDNQAIVDMLGEDDAVQYVVMISGEKVNTPAAIFTWTKHMYDNPLEKPE